MPFSNIVLLLLLLRLKEPRNPSQTICWVKQQQSARATHQWPSRKKMLTGSTRYKLVKTEQIKTVFNSKYLLLFFQFAVVFFFEMKRAKVSAMDSSRVWLFLSSSSCKNTNDLQLMIRGDEPNKYHQCTALWRCKV